MNVTEHNCVIRFKLGPQCEETASLKADFMAAVKASGADMSQVLRAAVVAYVEQNRAKA
jgi:hypothetical protein